MISPKDLLQQRLEEIEEVLKTVTKGRRGDMYLKLKAHRDIYVITINHINLIMDNKISPYNYDVGKKALEREQEARKWLNTQRMKQQTAAKRRAAKKLAQAAYRAKAKEAKLKAKLTSVDKNIDK